MILPILFISFVVLNSTNHEESIYPNKNKNRIKDKNFEHIWNNMTIQNLNHKEKNLKDFKKIIEFIDVRAKNFNLFGHDNESYTLNKKNIYLSFKDSNNEFYDKYMVLYILLHELSHCVTKSIGHTMEFYKNFDKLIKKATKLGFYNQ